LSAAALLAVIGFYVFDASITAVFDVVVGKYFSDTPELLDDHERIEKYLRSSAVRRRERLDAIYPLGWAYFCTDGSTIVSEPPPSPVSGRGHSPDFPRGILVAQHSGGGDP
jgi:hypothetical protein